MQAAAGDTQMDLSTPNSERGQPVSQQQGFDIQPDDDLWASRLISS